MINTILQGDALELAKSLSDNSIHCFVTSPPYWGLRSYGHWFMSTLWGDMADFTPPRKHKDRWLFRLKWRAAERGSGVFSPNGKSWIGALGLEPTPELFIEHMVLLFRELRRVLRKDGTLWLNMGDSYASAPTGNPGTKYTVSSNTIQSAYAAAKLKNHTIPLGLKPKDLCGIPWRLALALQQDGWYLRSDIIWSKPNPMPESVTDRPTKAHEYLFLLTKSPKYFYDSEAIREPAEYGFRIPRNGNGFRDMKYQNNNAFDNSASTQADMGSKGYIKENGRNRRSVWEIATQPFNGAKILTDYVGTDGKPYTRSEDCPIHGLSHGLRTQRMDGHDEQLNQFEQDNSDNSNYHGQELLGGSSSTHSLDYQDLQIANADEHILENTDENKTFYTSDMVEPQNHLDNLSIPEIDVYKLDSQDQPHVEIATDHNIQTHKTDHVPVTNQPYTLSSENSSHTDDKSMLPLLADLVDHTSENKTARVGWDGHPLAEKKSHNVDKSSYRHGNIAKCTCQEVTIDHFATFPEALIEPCILAGTSAKGVCGECGGPWERVFTTERVERLVGGKSPKHASIMESTSKSVFTTNLLPVTKTIGWQPTCKCIQNRTPNFGMKGSELLELADEIAREFAPVPAIVLDPFMGSGTTASVAKRLGRNWIGFELNLEYIKLATKRINNTQPPLFILT